MTDEKLMEMAIKAFETYAIGLTKKETDRLIALARIGASAMPRPIEEAPKDGTRMLLMKIVGHPDHETSLWWATMGCWSDKWQNWNDGIEPSGLAGPTHFILRTNLPKPQVKP